jgi:hypothetical protein
MTQRAPLRLSDATSDATPELRAAMRHARSGGPSAQQLERLMSGVIAQLPAPRPDAQANPQATDASNVAPAGEALLALRWLIWIAIGAGAMLAVHRALHPAPAPVAPSHAAVAMPERAPAPARPEHVVRPEQPSQLEQAQPAADEAVRAAPAHARVRRPAAPVQDPGAEIALLQQARRALASAPDQALALTQVHARSFPDGVFREEREALAVEALLALGRRAEANARVHALLERYPQSAYRRRIERLLAGTHGATSDRAP